MSIHFSNTLSARVSNAELPKNGSSASVPLSAKIRQVASHIFWTVYSLRYVGCSLSCVKWLIGNQVYNLTTLSFHRRMWSVKKEVFLFFNENPPAFILNAQEPKILAKRYVSEIGSGRFCFGASLILIERFLKDPEISSDKLLKDLSKLKKRIVFLQVVDSVRADCLLRQYVRGLLKRYRNEINPERSIKKNVKSNIWKHLKPHIKSIQSESNPQRGDSLDQIRLQDLQLALLPPKKTIQRTISLDVEEERRHLMEFLMDQLERWDYRAMLLSVNSTAAHTVAFCRSPQKNWFFSLGLGLYEFESEERARKATLQYLDAFLFTRGDATIRLDIYS